MNEMQKRQIKGALEECAKQNENKITPTFNIRIADVCRAGIERIEELEKENERLEARIRVSNETGSILSLIKGKLEEVCDYNCPVHKLATHKKCLTCSAVRKSPYHNLKNVSDEELQKIIKEAEEEMEI